MRLIQSYRNSTESSDPVRKIVQRSVGGRDIFYWVRCANPGCYCGTFIFNHMISEGEFYVPTFSLDRAI
jgi:hypothetical protein